MKIENYVDKEYEDSILDDLFHEDQSLWFSRAFFMIRVLHIRVFKYLLEKNIEFNLNFEDIMNHYLEIDKSHLLSKKEKEEIENFLNTLSYFNIEDFKNDKKINNQCIEQYDHLIDIFSEDLKNKYYQKLCENNLMKF